MGSERDTASSEAVDLTSGSASPNGDADLGPAPVGGDPGPQAQTIITRWEFPVWRLIGPLIVLGTIAYIALGNWDQLMANNWAFPALLAAVGVIALLFLLAAHPRRRKYVLETEPSLDDEISGAT